MKDKKEKYIFLVICSAVWVYLFIRAYCVPVVFDEATTFFIYIQKKSFLPYLAPWDANNHYLNSFLTIISYKLFGPSLLALRLPNLLFFPVFAYFTFRLSRFIENRFVRISLLATLILAHNFVEFFAFSRGYGMSMALLIASLYYLISALKTNNTGSYIKCLLMMSLAVSANLNLIITSLIVLLMLVIKIFATSTEKKANPVLKKLIVVFIFGIIPAILFSLFIFKLRTMGLLYYGDGGNLWVSSLKTITLLLTNIEHPVVRILVIMISAVLLFRLIWLLIVQFKERKLLLNAELVFYYLYFGNIAAMLAVHLLFGVKYPEDRTGMHLFPLLVCSLMFFLNNVEKQFSSNWKPIVLLPLLFFPVHFFMNINFSHSSWWHTERIPERFYTKIQSYQKPDSYPATLAGYFLQTPEWEYLNYTKGGTQNQMYASTFPFYLADFQIVEVYRNLKWLHYYHVDEFDDVSGFSLLKRKKECVKEFIYRSSEVTQTDTTSVEFYPLFEINSDSLAGRALYFCYDLDIKSNCVPLRACIVVSVNDSNNNFLIYEKIGLDQLKLKWDNESSRLRQNIMTTELPKGQLQIKTYFWNIEKVPFTITGSCSAYMIKSE